MLFRGADTHCHLGQYSDMAGVGRRAIRASVFTVVATNRASEFRALNAALRRQPGVTVGLGLHPEVAGSVYERHELAIFQAVHPLALWISEIGLDANLGRAAGSYFGGVPSLARQKFLFERILDLGVADRILSVHSRGAEVLCCDMLHAAGARAVVLHWFAGNRAAATKALDQGYFFSINPEALATEPGRRFVRWLPADRLLLETDGPFVDLEERPAEPGDLLLIASMLGEVRRNATDATLRATMANFGELEARRSNTASTSQRSSTTATNIVATQRTETENQIERDRAH